MQASHHACEWGIFNKKKKKTWTTIRSDAYQRLCLNEHASNGCTLNQTLLPLLLLETLNKYLDKLHKQMISVKKKNNNLNADLGLIDKRKTHIQRIAPNDLDISDWKWSCAPTQRQNFTFFSFFVLQLNLLMWSEGTSGRLSEINDPYFPSEASPHRGQMVRDVRVSGRSLILFFIWKGMAQTDVRNQDYVSVLRCFPKNKRVFDVDSNGLFFPRQNHKWLSKQCFVLLSKWKKE